MAVTPSMPVVFDALIRGLDQAPIGDGNYITVSDKFLGIDKISDANLPFLLLKTGNIQATEWDRFIMQVSWDIACELKVKGDPEGVEKYLQQVVEAIFGQIGLIRGLLVDDNLKVYPYADSSVQPYRDGLLTALAYRGGPFLTSFRSRPAQPDSPYRVADLTIHVEYLSDHNPTNGKYPLLDLLSVGFTPIAPDASYPNTDPALPWRYRIPVPAAAQDTTAQGRFIADGSFPVDGTSPPFPNRPIPALKGVSYGSLIKETVVSPRSASIAANGGTVQLSAIAYHVDGSSEPCSLTGSWASLTPSKASVSGSGLVTGLNAGTGAVTVQCSFGGAIGSATITLT